MSQHDTREKIVILGSGWAGYQLARKLSPSKFAVTLISPRSYFVFTPLLNDTAVGTLEFPHVVESVRSIPGINFVQAFARTVDFKNGTIGVEGSVTARGVTEAEAVQGESKGKSGNHSTDAELTKIVFDKLVITVGCVAQTFGTPGVKENALFLKDVGDARKIKRRILECFELASSPGCDETRQKQLLHFAAVGGGPTGMEFAAVLSDMIDEDMYRLYPELKGKASVTVYDVAPKVLSMFEESLSKYAAENMRRQGVSIKTEHHIKELRWGAPGGERRTRSRGEADPTGPLTLHVEEEGEVGVGCVVWSTGNAMNPFVADMDRVKGLGEKDLVVGNGEHAGDMDGTSWKFKKHDKTGPLLIDDYLRVQVVNGDTAAALRNVFALGDNAMIESGAPPATAQTADQESKWLAKRLNAGDLETAKPFVFNDKGVLTYVGNADGVVQTNKNKGSKLKNAVPEAITGKAAWLAWKGAYLSMTISWRNRALIAFHWAINYVFGRNISRF